MEKYILSGQFTTKMHDMLLDTTNFKPFNILTTQVDRSGVEQALKWRTEEVECRDIDEATGQPKKVKFCGYFFLDSGAFSIHTGNANTTLDEYAEYINTIHENVDVCAQLDKIPGEFGKSKKTEDYIESAEKSWEWFLELRDKVKCPEKIMPVSHFGEDVKYLKRMLEWKDPNGNQLDYIGLSPANDASKEERMLYLQNMYDIIKASSNSNVKTHIYGFTAFDAINQFPMYSCDSITHRKISAYNKILSRDFGIISVSRRPRTSKVKSNLSFLETADEFNLNKLRQEFYDYGMDLDYCKKWCGNDDRSKFVEGFDENDVLSWASESNAIRTVFCVKAIQYMIDNGQLQYHPKNRTRQKKLF